MVFRTPPARLSCRGGKKKRINAAATHKKPKSSPELKSHQLPLSLPLEEPLDGGLGGAGLTLQEGAAALHAELHRLSQPFLHCRQTQRAGDADDAAASTQQVSNRRSCSTFGVEASALAQRVSVSDVLPAAPPAINTTLV